MSADEAAVFDDEDEEEEEEEDELVYCCLGTLGMNNALGSTFSSSLPDSD